MTKHGVKNGIAMVTHDTLNGIFSRILFSNKINFSKSHHI